MAAEPVGVAGLSRVPLALPDRDVPLNLAAVVAQAYAAGRYEKLFDRTAAPEGLAEADLPWARHLVGG